MSDQEGTSSKSHRGTRYDVLLAEAVPELVRVNAFRLTQLPVSATQREIARQVEKIRMAEKLGVSTGTSGGLMPVPGGADADILRNALQRLRDPEKHLIDELFWFWPLENGGADDLALTALSADDREAAARLWVAAHGDGGRRGSVALHNLAVLALVGVVDSEFEERDGVLNAERRKTLPDLWKVTFERWAELRKTPVFWTAMKKRVEQINDPRLTEDVVWNVRKTLPEALAGLAARLAVSLWSAGRADACRRILEALWASDLPQADVKRAVRSAVHPIRKRLKANIDKADAEVRHDSSGNRPLEIAKRLLEQCEPLLLVIDAALPKGDPTRTGLHDDIAQSVLRFTVAWVNATDNFQGAKTWVERALKIAEGDAALERIRENQRINNENLAVKGQQEQTTRLRSPAYTPNSAAPQKERGGCLTCGVVIGIIVVIIVILSAIANSCSGSSSSSSSSSSGYSSSVSDQSSSDYSSSGSGSGSSSSTVSSGKPFAGYWERSELNDLFKRVWAAHGATPQTLKKAYPSLSRKLNRLERQIRQWLRDYDTYAGTQRVAREGARFAAATAAWYADPFSDSKFNAYKRAFDVFERHYRGWSP